jgi:phytoene desaturase
VTKAVVIGGGPVGLSTAALLAHGGLEVTLLERREAMGGRTAPLSTHGHTVDPQPWFLAPEAYEDFFSLLGRDLEDYLELIDPESRFRAFFEEGPDTPAQVLDLDDDAQTNWERIEALSPGDGESARRFVLKAARDHVKTLERLDRSPAHGALSLVRPTALVHLPWVIANLVRSLGGATERAVRHPMVRRLLEFPAISLTGSPKTTPAAYTYLCYHHLGGAVRHPRGGFGAVIAAIERVAHEEGVKLCPSSEVARILIDPQSRLASALVLRSGDILPADVVVSCVDVHHTETSLLPEEFRFFPESSWGRFVPSPSSLIVMVGVKKGLPQLAHHNLFFPRNWGRTLASLGSDPIDDPFASDYLYVGRPTATDPPMAPKGKESLVLIAPLPADPTLGATDESRQALTNLAARLLGQVEVLAAIPELTKRSRILEVVTPADLEREYSTWRGAGFGLAPTLRGLTLGRSGSASRRVRNLLYAGSSLLPGVGVPGGLASAELVAKSLLGQNDPTPLPVPVGRGFLVHSRRRDALGDLLRASAAEEALGPG